MNNIKRLIAPILFNLMFCIAPYQISLTNNPDLLRNSHNPQNGLADNTIFDMRYGDNNIIFVGTGEGLSYIDLSSFNNSG